MQGDRRLQAFKLLADRTKLGDVCDEDPDTKLVPAYRVEAAKARGAGPRFRQGSSAVLKSGFLHLLADF